MKRHGGLSFIEIVFSGSLLLLLLVPLGLLLTQARRETRVSVDEFHGALYLTELVDQVASLPFAALPLTTTPLILTKGDSALLNPANPMTALHLTELRSNFTARLLEITPPPHADGILKKVHATVTYRRPDGKDHRLDMVTFVGSGTRSKGGLR